MADKTTYTIATWKLPGRGYNYESDMYKVALDFLSGADKCLNGCIIDKENPMLLWSGVVCASFCIELFLKLIVFRQSGRKLKGHDLEKLFSELTKESSENIERKTAPSNIFQKILKSVALNFVNVRYEFEEDKLIQFQENFLLRMAKAARTEYERISV
ncbi:MAG: HEPN domain-containing protein [Tissierellales bacterium]|nr:HEPN domain-containing protein [Tissierellales bacterium]